MHGIKQLLMVTLIIFSGQSIGAEKYLPNSGDQQLDASLLSINKTVKNKNNFSQLAAEEFQVPLEKVLELFKMYEFTAADVLMTLSIADVSGLPVNTVSRTYFENKQQGWVVALDLLDINHRSASFQQIKSDAKMEFIEQ